MNCSCASSRCSREEVKVGDGEERDGGKKFCRLDLVASASGKSKRFFGILDIGGCGCDDARRTLACNGVYEAVLRMVGGHVVCKLLIDFGCSWCG